MAFCSQCGGALPGASAFCPSCGAAQASPASPSGYAPPPVAPPPAAQGWQAPPPVAPPPAAQGWQAPPPVPPPSSQAWSQASHAWSDGAGMLSRTISDIRGFSFRWVVPIDTALSPALLRNPTVWVMLLFGFYPLLAMPLKLITSVEDLARTLVIYCALAWAGYFYYFVCKRSVDYLWGGAVMLFTAFVGIRLVYVLWGIPPFTFLRPMTDEGHDLVSHLVGYTFGVGVIEELTKAVPVLVLAYAMARVEKPLDGLFFGAMSGLGFGIAEGTQYILAPGANVVSVLLRLTTLPFAHALWAGIVGYFVGLAQINKKRGIALIVIGYAVSVVCHGAYDALGGILSLCVAAFTYLLFSAYLERSQQMVTELAQAEQQAARETTLEQMFRDTYIPAVHVSSPTGSGQ